MHLIKGMIFPGLREACVFSARDSESHEVLCCEAAVGPRRCVKCAWPGHASARRSAAGCRGRPSACEASCVVFRDVVSRMWDVLSQKSWHTVSARGACHVREHFVEVSVIVRCFIGSVPLRRRPKVRNVVGSLVRVVLRRRDAHRISACGAWHGNATVSPRAMIRQRGATATAGWQR